MESLQIKIFQAIPEEYVSQVNHLQKVAFTDISKKESDEDFINSEDAFVLAILNNEVVGCAGIHHSDIKFEGRFIKLGGFGGVCTRSDMRGKGIATQVCMKAMDYLKERGDDVAFLGIDLSKGTNKLYEKFGFVLLPREFSWENINAEVRSDAGGMIAPVNSIELFSLILNSSTRLHVGKGNW